MPLYRSTWKQVPIEKKKRLGDLFGNNENYNVYFFCNFPFPIENVYSITFLYIFLYEWFDFHQKEGDTKGLCLCCINN